MLIAFSTFFDILPYLPIASLLAQSKHLGHHILADAPNGHPGPQGPCHYERPQAKQDVQRCTNHTRKYKNCFSLLHYVTMLQLHKNKAKKKIEKRLNSSLVSIDILPSSTLRLVYWYRCKACVLQLRSLDLCGKKCARTERTERTKPCHQLFDQVPIRPIRCQKKCIWCLWAQLENSILSAEKGKERQR